MTEPASLLPLLASLVFEVDLNAPWLIRRVIARDHEVLAPLARQLVGQPALALVDDDSRDAMRAQFKVIAHHQEDAIPGSWHSFGVNLPDQAKLYLRVRPVAIRRLPDVPPTLIVIARNITRATKAQETLTSQRALMNALFVTLTDAALLADQHGMIREINPAFEEAFGYQADAIVGQSIIHLLVGQEEDPRRERFAFSRTGGLPFISTRLETYARHCSGALLPVEVSVSVFHADGAPSFLMTIRDLTEARSLEERLLQAIDQASAASRARSELLAHVSHELRTPLNAIVGFSELAGMRIDNAAAGREVGSLGSDNGLELARHVRSIHDAGVRLLTAVDGMLKIAHLEEYRPNHPAMQVTVETLARRVLDSHQALAQRAGVMLEADIDPTTNALLLEGDSLQRALGNLLHNAIRLSPPASAVTLSIRRSGQSLLFAVSDHGPGFSPALLAKLKLPLVLTDGENAGRPGEAGLGLGLAIAKTIAELHGGSLSVATHDHGGSITTLRIPISGVTPPEKLS